MLPPSAKCVLLNTELTMFLGSYSAEAAAQKALLWLGCGAVGSAQEAKQSPAHQTVYRKHPLKIKVRKKKAT